MKTSTKMGLFGGALMTAGMAAQAQTFLYADTDITGGYTSFATSGAYSYGFTTDSAYAPDALNTGAYGYSAYTGGTTMATTQTATSMGHTANWDGYGLSGYGFGYTFMQQFFQVSADATLLFEWDVSGTDGYAGAIVIEDATGGTLFAWSPLAGDAATGSASVAVSAGVDYALIFGFQDIFSSGFGPFIFDSTETQFINVTLVPTPASAALLGLGGLVATRRRRS